MNEWIPVDEALPTEDVYYLVTCNDGSDNVVDMAKYCGGEWGRFIGLGDAWETWDDVIAWMPLPEAYHVCDTKC